MKLKARLKHRADVALRTLLSHLARPLSIKPGAGPCLVLAPHPDDETLGCGSLVAAMVAAGREVWVVIVADGGGCRLASVIGRDDVVRIRQREALQACAALGVPGERVVFLGLPDGSLGANRGEIVTALGRVAGQVKPSSVFAPFHEEAHPDHVALAQAVRLLQESGSLAAPAFEYPVWLPTRVAAGMLFDSAARGRLRRAGPIGGGVQSKREALAAYASQRPVWRGVRIDGALSDEFIELFANRGEIYFGNAMSA